MGQSIVLLVEDDPALLKLYSYIIQKAGYEVLTADSAQSALDRLRKTVPSLIIQDLSLPDISGMQLLSLIRGNQAYQNIPVIIISGCEGRIESVKLSNEKCVAYLQKPIEADVLLKNVNQYFNK